MTARNALKYRDIRLLFAWITVINTLRYGQVERNSFIVYMNDSDKCTQVYTIEYLFIQISYILFHFWVNVGFKIMILMKKNYITYAQYTVTSWTYHVTKAAHSVVGHSLSMDLASKWAQKSKLCWRKFLTITENISVSAVWVCWAH